VTERGPIFDAAREAYEAAQGRLSDLIDGPNCNASISGYRRELKEAQRAVSDAHKTMMEAWG